MSGNNDNKFEVALETTTKLPMVYIDRDKFLHKELTSFGVFFIL